MLRAGPPTEDPLPDSAASSPAVPPHAPPTLSPSWFWEPGTFRPCPCRSFLLEYPSTSLPGQHRLDWLVSTNSIYEALTVCYSRHSGSHSQQDRDGLSELSSANARPPHTNLQPGPNEESLPGDSHATMLLFTRGGGATSHALITKGAPSTRSHGTYSVTLGSRNCCPHLQMRRLRRLRQQ